MKHPPQRLLALALLVVGGLALSASPVLATPSSGAAAAQTPPPTSDPGTTGGEATSAPAGAEAEKPNVAEKGKALLVAFLEDPWGRTRFWLLDRGPLYAATAFQALVLLLFFRWLGGWLGRIVRGALTRSRTNASELLLTFTESVVSKIIFFVGIVMALSVVGVDIGPFLAGVGVLGFVVGFALQDSLGNFAAGIMLMMYRPFDVGHFVEVAGQTGTVVGTTLVSTTLKTPDNQRLMIPNGKVWGGVIRNVTEQKTRRVDLTFGIGYDDDILLTEETLAQLVADHPKVLQDPAPVIKLHALADSSVNFVVRAWAQTGDYWDVYWDLTRQVKLTFDEKGIGIPYPQRDVHLYQVDASK